MSSHSVRLAQRLKDFRKAQKAIESNLSDEYTRGLYNGLELAWSLMNNTLPVYAGESQIETLNGEKDNGKNDE